MKTGEESVKSQGLLKTSCCFSSSHLFEDCLHTSINFVNLIKVLIKLTLTCCWGAKGLTKNFCAQEACSAS